MDQKLAADIRAAAQRIETHAKALQSSMQFVQREGPFNMSVDMIRAFFGDLLYHCDAIRKVQAGIIPQLEGTGYTWNVFLEHADGDKPKQLIGTIQAESMARGLEEAVIFYEHPVHDLVLELPEESSEVQA